MSPQLMAPMIVSVNEILSNILFQLLLLRLTKVNVSYSIAESRAVIQN